MNVKRKEYVVPIQGTMCIIRREEEVSAKFRGGRCRKDLIVERKLPLNFPYHSLSCPLILSFSLQIISMIVLFSFFSKSFSPSLMSTESIFSPSVSGDQLVSKPTFFFFFFFFFFFLIYSFCLILSSKYLMVTKCTATLSFRQNNSCVFFIVVIVSVFRSYFGSLSFRRIQISQQNNFSSVWAVGVGPRFQRPINFSSLFF